MILLNKSPKQLWTADLDRFLVEWDETVEAHAAFTNLTTKKKGKKNAVLRTRKSIGTRGGNSDDDDPSKHRRKRLLRRWNR